MKYFFVLVFILSINIFPQTERYTKGAENGYAWRRMEDPSQFYSTSKETYLASILDRIRLTGEKYPEIESLSCRDDMEKLFSEGKSEDMIIPIIFAYCHSIKKFAGSSGEELYNYKQEVLLFCNE
ncbi:MAG: hypothetical protein MUE64_02990 [Ignavibacteriaceae bacterium]|nr:hypothetical protein [Ignavibacteriaceae bacterium]